jgi:hypothetical protein
VTTTGASASLAEELSAAWRRLPSDLPVERLGEALTPALPSAALEALLASPRLGQRLADRVAERLGLKAPEPGDFDDAASRLVLKGRAAVLDAARLAGTIRQGTRIVRLVLREERERVRAAVGAQAYDLALSAARNDEAPAGGGTVENLISDCAAAGPRCLAAWSAELPDAVGGWLRLLGEVPRELVPALADRRDVEAARLGAGVILARADG